MTWRHSTRKRCGAVVIAVAMGGLVPAGSVWADEPVESVATSPDDGGDQTPAQPVDDSAPETGEVDGTKVAVGAPPVPPVSETPQVAVGVPPVPPAALFDTVSAALDLVADCL